MPLGQKVEAAKSGEMKAAILEIVVLIVVRRSMPLQIRLHRVSNFSKFFLGKKIPFGN